MNTPLPRDGGAAVQQLLETGDWLNIQDIVRDTFRAFEHVITAQGEAIRVRSTKRKRLEEEAKEARKEIVDVKKGLRTKPNIADFNSKLIEFNTVLKSKADAIKVSDKIDRCPTKEQLHETLRSSVGNLAAEMGTKVIEVAQGSADDLRKLRDEMESTVEELRSELQRKMGTQELLKRLEHLEHTKAEVSEVNQALLVKADAAAVEDALKDKAPKGALTAGLNRKANKSDLDNAIESLRLQIVDVAREHGRMIAAQAATKAEREEVADLRAHVSREMSAKHEDMLSTTRANSNNESQLRALREYMKSQLDELRHELQHSATTQTAQQSSMSERLGRLQEHVDVDSATAVEHTGKLSQLYDGARRVEAALADAAAERQATRAAVEAVRAEAVAKVNALAVDVAAINAETARVLELKADVAQVTHALEQKANTSAVNQALERIEEMQGLGKLREALDNKANVNDVCALLDLKPNISDVNQALCEIQRAIDSKCESDELRRVVRDQAVVNATVVMDSSFGRWIWKGGKTKHGGVVPWNVQSVNTDPENYLWAHNRTSSITTVVPGLYEVTFGFFTHQKPTVQLLVNEEPVLAAVSSSSYVVHHPAGRLEEKTRRHSAGSVTGLTLIDFLALPPQARVSITYTGADVGEGFLSLKKL